MTRPSLAFLTFKFRKRNGNKRDQSRAITFEIEKKKDDLIPEQ